jgi:hypothetical protein
MVEANPKDFRKIGDPQRKFEEIYILIIDSETTFFPNG